MRVQPCGFFLYWSRNERFLGYWGSVGETAGGVCSTPGSQSLEMSIEAYTAWFRAVSLLYKPCRAPGFNSMDIGSASSLLMDTGKVP